jgi:hypothetical protein
MQYRQDCDKGMLLQSEKKKASAFHAMANACDEARVHLRLPYCGSLFEGLVGTIWEQDETSRHANILKNKEYLEKLAREKLGGYHLIVINEWLKIPEQIFGVKHINRKAGMQCKKLTVKANLENPLNVTQEELELLTHIDNILIHYYRVANSILVVLQYYYTSRVRVHVLLVIRALYV